MPICRRLLVHFVRLPFSFALARAGSSIAARIAMIAMTTNSSIKVKADEAFRERSLVTFVAEAIGCILSNGARVGIPLWRGVAQPPPLRVQSTSCRAGLDGAPGRCPNSQPRTAALLGHLYG